MSLLLLVSVPPYRILVVDDLIDNLFFLQMMLEAEGYCVETADGGQRAIAMVEANPPDLILLDWMMPDMNGREVIQWIRQKEELASLPILVVTAYEEPKGMEELGLRASDFVSKPIDLNKLLERVRTAL